MRFWRTQIWTLSWAQRWIIYNWLHLTKYQCKLPEEKPVWPIHVRIIGCEERGYQTLQGQEVWHPVVFPPATLSIKGHCGQECLLNTCADAIWPFIACLPRMFFLEFRLSCHGDQPNRHFPKNGTTQKQFCCVYPCLAESRTIWHIKVMAQNSENRGTNKQ